MYFKKVFTSVFLSGLYFSISIRKAMLTAQYGKLGSKFGKLGGVYFNFCLSSIFSNILFNPQNMGFLIKFYRFWALGLRNVAFRAEYFGIYYLPLRMGFLIFFLRILAFKPS